MCADYAHNRYLYKYGKPLYSMDDKSCNKKMTKVKELKTKKSSKSKVTVKDILKDVRKKLNARQVEKITEILEEKIDQLHSAKKVVAKIEKQIKDFENMDINEIDTDNYDFEY